MMIATVLGLERIFPDIIKYFFILIFHHFKVKVFPSAIFHIQLCYTNEGFLIVLASLVVCSHKLFDDIIGGSDVRDRVLKQLAYGFDCFALHRIFAAGRLVQLFQGFCEEFFCFFHIDWLCARALHQIHHEHRSGGVLRFILVFDVVRLCDSRNHF